MRINNNLMAMNTNRQLGISNKAGAKSMEKLSSGFRINRASDDAAGLSISEKMRNQIKGLNRASANSQDGISLIQTAEGALDETHAILKRMRELAVQAGNEGTQQSDDLESIKDEFAELAKELDGISDRTEFNGKKLLDGSYKGTIQIGANQGQQLDINVGVHEIAGEGVNKGKSVLGANDVIVKEQTAAREAAKTIDSKDLTITADEKILEIKFVKGTAGTAGKDVAAKASFAAGVLTITGGNDGTTVNPITLDDIKSAMAADASTKDLVLDIKGADATTKFGEAAANGDDIKLATKTGTAPNEVIKNEANVKDTTLGGSLDSKDLGVSLASTKLEADGSNLKDVLKEGIFFGFEGMSQDDVKASTDTNLERLDAANKAVSKVRSHLGANQNRLEHTIRNLDNAAENIQASESRIRDVDMAKEMIENTKQNILQQASTAMLAQANQAPQSVLRLLG